LEKRETPFTFSYIFRARKKRDRHTKKHGLKSPKFPLYTLNKYIYTHSLSSKREREREREIEAPFFAW